MNKFTVNLTYRVPTFITYNVVVQADNAEAAALIAQVLVDEDEAGDGTYDTCYDDSTLVHEEVIPL